MHKAIKSFIYLNFLFIGFLLSLESPVFSAETKGTGECPSGFHGNKKSSHAQTRPKQGDSFEYVIDRSLEERIGYVFRNPDLKTINGFYSGRINPRYVSRGNPRRIYYFWNGKPLDLLGDAVLNFSVADILLRLYPYQHNPDRFHKFIANDFLAGVAASFNIGRDIYPDKYSSDSKLHDDLSPSSRKQLADLLEALIGVVYLDRDYIEARKFVARLIKRELKGYDDKAYKALFENNSDTHFSSTEQTYFSNSSSHNIHSKKQLEFLGSYFLQLYAIDILMEQYPKGKDLHKKRDTLVSAILQQPGILNKLDPDPRLRNFSQNKQKTTNAKRAFLFFLGAVYVEEGFERTRTLVERVIEEINRENSEFREDNNKSLLNDVAQKQFQTVPEYQLVEETGTMYEKVFVMEVWINDQMLGKGRGRTKKDASQAAATVALRVLGLLD